MINAYMVDAGEHRCVIESLGELGSIYGMERIISVVWAETRSKAKAAFIKFHASHASYTQVDFEFTDPMKITLLAKNMNHAPEVDPSCDLTGIYWYPVYAFVEGQALHDLDNVDPQYMGEITNGIETEEIEYAKDADARCEDLNAKVAKGVQS